MAKVVAMEKTIFGGVFRRAIRVRIAVAIGVAIVGIVVGVCVSGHIFTVLNAFGVGSLDHGCNICASERRRYSSI